ncbi:MAG: 4-(cytidine 5'-diphospho)-2-C-methyl-D-erythritol kinase [Rikenellaceae bacterium]
MIDYSPCKINLGLNVIRKRSDGYHDLETLFYEVSGRPDIIELQPSAEDSFSSSGIIVDCPAESNLCCRALRLLRDSGYLVPPTSIHLHKQIPFGAGLGGGSANATYVLRMANTLYSLGISVEELEVLSGALGSDTSFFVRGGAQLGFSRGEVLEPVDFSLAGYHLYIVMPDLHISTALAFSGIKPCVPRFSIRDILSRDFSFWRSHLVNDFEGSLFPVYERLAQIKQTFYSQGAVYASMSGSGASVYGIFEKPVDFAFEDLWHYEVMR